MTDGKGAKFLFSSKYGVNQRPKTTYNIPNKEYAPF